MWRRAARLPPQRFEVARRRRPALLAALHKDKMQPMSFRAPRGAVSLSIFHEQQPNRRVGIIKHRLGYTATEDTQEAVHRRRGSGGTPQRISGTGRNLISLFHCTHTHTHTRQAKD